MTRLALTLLTVAASSLPAAAHSGHAPLADVLAGFLHPLSGLDHLIAMFALGFWAAVMGGRALWFLPLVFVLAMSLGSVTAPALALLPLAEMLILASGLLLAALALLRFRLAPFLALPMTALFALAHGHVHGAAFAVGLDTIAPAVGYIAATASLHLAGMLLAYLTSSTEVRAFRATS